MISIIFLLLQLGFAIFLIYWIIAFLTGAPFVPSSDPTAGSMIALARLKPGMRVYDLGSGEGKLLFAAATRGAHSVGIEINPWLVLYTRIRALLSPYRKLVDVRWQSFWKTDIRDADVVFIYLLPWRMLRLEKKLKKELKKGAIVVSNSFIFPNWKILRQDAKRHVYVFAQT